MYDINSWFDVLFLIIRIGKNIYDVLMYEFEVLGMKFTILTACVGGGLIFFLGLRLVKWFIPMS